MKSVQDLLLLLLKLKPSWVVRHPLQQCSKSINNILSYLCTILRLAVSWIRKVTIRTSRRTKHVRPLDSPRPQTLDVALPSIVPISSTSPQPERSTAVPQQFLPTRFSTILPRSSSQDSNSPQPVTYIANNIVAVTTLEFERYQREYKQPQAFNESYMIKQFTTDFSAFDLPHNWIAYTHPEGALYFHDKSRRILTDVYLFDKTALKDWRQ
ncbi:hypothetical protein BDQ17DRAFT_1427305 [Cyathus striatus]|nr:hypothetical protein BDQ17DRAFT_1427305 [Cyathus striatus]